MKGKLARATVRHIVIDTNVLISAGLLPNSVSAHALTLAFERFVMAQNQATWHELQDRIVRKKFDRYFGVMGRLDLLARLAQNTTFFEPVAVATDSRDATDNKFLGLSLDAQATCILSGDRDLQILHPYKTIPIYSPGEFIAEMAGRMSKPPP